MAEIKQKIISCPRGHYYDANRYSSCPHCGSGNFSPTEAPSGMDVIGGTQPVNEPGNIGAFNPTQPPHEIPRGGAQFSETIFVDSSTPTGSPSPVVGWLVAVEGPCRGTDYRIHTNYNYIGRETGDICIHGDFTISAERDTSITYVPKTRQFYIAHEFGKNVLLVNDEPVIGGGKPLKNYDLITIGNTQLVFVALCGPEFGWDSEAGTDGE